MKWGPEQDKTLMDVSSWFRQKNKKQIYRIFGYAGTGKTTLAKYFREQISGSVAYAAYTGKAASVMRSKGCENATTIHSLIYTPEVDKKTGEVSFKYNHNSMLKSCELLIVDECSMVDDDMAEDILSYGVPVLVLGDTEQLPPVNGEGYFTRETPDNMLTEIHRQALENPIIYLSMKARKGEYIKHGGYGDSLVVSKVNKNEMFAANQIISGKNDTRRFLNKTIRKYKKYEGSLPNVGERLVCLQNKINKKTGERLYFNGGQYEVVDRAQNLNIASVHSNYTVKSCDNEDVVSSAKILNHPFRTSEERVGCLEPNWKDKSYTVEFDYGYCVTCHKSQGSQWQTVYVYDESAVFGQHRKKWLYTAITRASENVVICRGD